MKTTYIKLIAFLCIGTFFVSCSNTKEQKEFTTAEYEAAAAQMDKGLNDLVYNKVSEITFTDTSNFRYATNTKDGKKYIMVDAISKNKKAVLDPKKLVESTTKGSKKALENESISPNGKLAAYIDTYNLWVRDLESDEKTQLTFDGIQDYGYATNNAGWTKSDGAVLKWSPNSDKIATFQQDARGVGMMYLTSTNVGHPTLEAWKHPLPGDKIIFTIERVIIHLANKPKTVRLKMDKDFQRGSTTDHIAGRNSILLDAQWNKEGTKFAFVSGSRDHKIAHLQIADATTGAVESIHKEEVATYYESGVDSENWSVLFDSNEFIWYSEKSNWGHLYLYDLTTKRVEKSNYHRRLDRKRNHKY